MRDDFIGSVRLPSLRIDVNLVPHGYEVDYLIDGDDAHDGNYWVRDFGGNLPPDLVATAILAAAAETLKGIENRVETDDAYLELLGWTRAELDAWREAEEMAMESADVEAEAAPKESGYARLSRAFEAGQIRILRDGLIAQDLETVDGRVKLVTETLRTTEGRVFIVTTTAGERHVFGGLEAAYGCFAGLMGL